MTVFVLPPECAALEARLRSAPRTATRSSPQRMAKSAEEMSHWPEYDYVIINDDLEASVAQAQAIVTTERLSRERQVGLADFVTRLRGG